MTDYPDLLARHDYAILNKTALWTQPWHAELPLYPLVPRELPGDADKMPPLLPLAELSDPQKERLCD
jgi:hypothetical protein